MRAVARTFIATAVLGGCAGGAASGPFFSFAPSPAREYEVRDLVNILVEIPGSTIESVVRANSALTLRVAGADGEASAVLTFDAFSLDVSGDQGSFSHDGGRMVGAPFSGHLASEGGFHISDAPEIPADLLARFDPATVLVALFPPLPGNAGAARWPHRYEVADRTELAGTSSFVGEARFEGDTVVNGRSGRIIVSEGIGTQVGHGQPEGSPVPVDVEVSMSVRSVWVWDPSAGVMLGARIESEGSGNMSMQGFDIPLTISATTTVALR